MDKRLLITVVAIFTILYGVNLVLAASVSVASVIIPSSSNQGDSFTLSASISGSSATSVSATLSLPSGITCTPTSSQSVSLSSSNTGTATWSCTGNVAGDYTNKITVSVSATDSSTGGSLSGSTQTGLKVLSPASLAASSTTKSGSVIFTIGVNNAGDLDTTYTVSTSCGSAACTAPSGTQSISGKAVKSHDVTVSGSAGTYTATATITSANGQTLTTSQSVTIAAEQAAAAAAAATASTAAVVPGTKVTLQKGKATITIPSVAAGKAAEVNINRIEDIAFRKIIISVANAVNNIQVTVTKLDAKPTTITQEVSGKVYHYIQVDKVNVTDANINQTIIRFEINKTWITGNNVNKSAINLFRYTDKWDKLQTSEISDDGQNILYEAISPGLSVFAIGSGDVAAPAAAPTPAPTPAAEKPPEEKATGLVPTKGRTALIIILVLVVAAAGVVFFLVKKNVIKLGKIAPKKGSNWDDLKKKYSKR